MNSEQLHNKFNDGNIRNYLGETFMKSGEISLFVSVKELENQILVLQEKLVHAKIVENIECTLKDKNWQRFDASEMIDFNVNPYMDFIDTEEEYQKVLEIYCDK